MLLRTRDSLLLIVDMQEKLAPATLAPEAAIARAALLVKAAARLGVPVLISEHYAKGIGHTVPELSSLAPDHAAFDKIHFSCLREPGVAARITRLGRRQVVLAGMETHVCVLQTALSLLEADYQVFLATDATSSRRGADRDAAFARLERAGGTLVTAEMTVFEWLERGDTPAFRDLLKIIR